MSWRRIWKLQKVFLSNIKTNQKLNKDGNEDIIAISYNIKFIDKARCVATSLSNLVVYNLAEETHKIKCKDCNCFSEYESVNYNLMK